MNTFFRPIKHTLTMLARVTLLAMLTAGCAAAPGVPPSPTLTATMTSTPTPEPPKAGVVNVWLTSADQSSLLVPQPELSFGPAASAESTQVIYVNENNQYQQMDGFGAALTDSSAWLIYTQLSPTQRAGVMSALFSSSEGIGISAMRLPMGASDFVHGDPYTYDDMPAGQVDPDLAHFSIEHDKAYIIPVLQAALKINPELKIIASPWSAPAWMKSSDSLLNGTLQKQYYEAYASYYVKFIQAYQAENIPVYAITPQNEPHYEPNSYPGMRLDSGDEAEFIKNHLGPAFAAAGIKTKILIWDHNWNEWKYPIEVLDDQQAKAYIGGSAFHCYAGIVLGQQLVHEAHPDMDIYFTECSSGAWIPTVGEGMKRDMKDLVIGATRNWAKTVIMWNLALDTSYGPHNGGCGNCYGFVTVDPKSESGFTFNYDYYAIGHASKFVFPGAYRIASSSFQFQNLESVAFKNPDGSKVLIVSNNSSTDKAFTVNFGDQAFSYALPSGSTATFTWIDAQKNAALPAQPANPKAKVNAAKIIVNWDFSPLADSYNLKRSEQPGGPYTAIATGIALPEYVDTQITSGSTYYYVVSAVNKLGESQDSAEAQAGP